MKYRVEWTETTRLWMLVEADSTEEAIAKAKGGRERDCLFIDSEPGKRHEKSFRCKPAVAPTEER